MRELARRVRTPEDVDALVRALDGGSADALRARLRAASPIRTTFASGDFDTIDANEDGVIDRDEWNAAHDANEDGVIDRDEWNAAHGIGNVRGRKPCLRDLTWDEMRALAFVSSVPFVGFGFCDNMIMIMSGDIIESHLGVAMGLSTMGAAAMGNLVSDVLGISLAKYIERGASKLGIHLPPISPQMMESAQANKAKAFGCAAGVMVGCVLGMTPLVVPGFR